MDELIQISNWYVTQCNDEWEHRYGIRMETLDNPGWLLKIDLKGTNLEGKHFTNYNKGVNYQSGRTEEDWFDFKVENDVFQGAGSPNRLQEILQAFLTWKDGQSA